MATVVVTNAIDRGLSRLGLTEYEGRAYLALLRHAGAPGYSGATGYEVAKASGVPRAKIYEVLRTLGLKGAAYTHIRGTRTFHFAADPEELLRRHLDDSRDLVAELGPVLNELRDGSRPGPQVATIEGYEQVLAKAEKVIESSTDRVFVTGLPEHVPRIGAALLAAESRGVRVFAVTYGPAELPVERHFEKNPVSDDLPIDAGVLWLSVIADNIEALIGQPAPEPEPSAIWSTIPAIANTAAEHVRHEIFVVEMDRIASEHGLDLNPDLFALQVMWFNDRLKD